MGWDAQAQSAYETNLVLVDNKHDVSFETAFLIFSFLVVEDVKVGP